MSARSMTVVGLSVACFALVAGCAGPVAPPSPTQTPAPPTSAAVTIWGQVRSVKNVNNQLLDLPQDGSQCRSGDDPSVVTGAQVLLLDSSGHLIGEGEISSPGTLRAEPNIGLNMYCTLSYTIETTSDRLVGDLFTIRFGSGGYEQGVSRNDLDRGPDFQVGQFYWH